MIHTLAKEKSTTKTEALTIFKKGLFYSCQSTITEF